MTVSPRTGLLPGISAHGWMGISGLGASLFFGILALSAAVSFTGFATQHPFLAADHPVAVYGWLGGFIAVIVLTMLAQVAMGTAMRRELRAGYSTLPLATLSVDIRDPRDGRILLPAGEGPRRGLFRLGPLRRQASSRPADFTALRRAPDREPGPIRRLELPAGGHALFWGRRRLSAFHAAIVAAEPDAFLIDALRQPLVEAAVAEYRPGARLHYTYLLAVRASGVELWQDTERPALIAEIPRDSITDVVPTEITNDRLQVLGIAILIRDPAWNPTSLPFLPLRPSHPLLFVKSNDIRPLIEEMRRIWGMPPAA